METSGWASCVWVGVRVCGTHTPVPHHHPTTPAVGLWAIFSTSLHQFPSICTKRVILALEVDVEKDTIGLCGAGTELPGNRMLFVEYYF